MAKKKAAVKSKEPNLTSQKESASSKKKVPKTVAKGGTKTPLAVKKKIRANELEEFPQEARVYVKFDNPEVQQTPANGSIKITIDATAVKVGLGDPTLTDFGYIVEYTIGGRTLTDYDPVVSEDDNGGTVTANFSGAIVGRRRVNLTDDELIVTVLTKKSVGLSP
jgi:hypothetical protein